MLRIFAVVEEIAAKVEEQREEMWRHRYAPRPGEKDRPIATLRS
jgi:hypothetical protein